MKSLDANNAHRVKAEIKGIVDENTQNLLLDFSKVHFVDSTGFGALISVLKTMKGQGGNLILFNLSPEVTELMDLMQLGSVFEVKKTEQEAIDAIS